MVDFSNRIVDSMYLSNDGLDKWAKPYGSFDDNYPISNGLPAYPKVGPCNMRYNYDYYVTEFPASMGLDPVPLQRDSSTCSCGYGYEAYNKWFSNEDYVRRMYGAPVSSNDLRSDYPLYQQRNGCAYCADLAQKGVLNLRDDMYLLNGQEINMRL